MVTEIIEEDNVTAVSGAKQFPQTRWSLVLEAVEEDPAALADLCKAYWYPLYAYARRRGARTEDAEDLTQGFFGKMLGTDFFSQADVRRGRLRTFLLSSFRNFMFDEWEKGQALKRGGGVQPLSIDGVSAEAWLALEPANDVTPELEFERSWAREILRLTRERLRNSYAEAGKAAEFALLQDHLEPNGGRPYSDLAADLGVKEARVRYLVFKLRQRFSHFLREAVASTVASPAEADQELAHIMKVFQR